MSEVSVLRSCGRENGTETECEDEINLIRELGLDKQFMPQNTKAVDDLMMVKTEDEIAFS